MLRLILAGSIAGLAMLGGSAEAQFYAGKSITLITSMGPGGSNDLVARMIAREMPRYLPGHPTIIVQNMPGGGNVVATNYLFNIAREGRRPRSASSTMRSRSTRRSTATACAMIRARSTGSARRSAAPTLFSSWLRRASDPCRIC